MDFAKPTGEKEEKYGMGLEGVKEKALLYHLTEVSNMKMIVNYGLLPRRYLLEHNMIFGDVADPQIISKREELGLDMYTPFHFHPYSAFDVAVKNTYSSKKFVYICIKRAFAEFNNFKILVRHPLSQQECVLYDYIDGINNIDWNTMEKTGTVDEYSRNVKMAECLTDKGIPAELFQCVYVPDMETKQYIEELFQKKGILEHPPYVSIQPKWF